MRIAFVDLLFSWPPHGGADADLYHVARELHRLGYDLRVFVTRDTDSWERGACEPEALPFPATRLDFTRQEFTREQVVARLVAAVDEFAPDLVCVCDGFFLKPYVLLALAHYPLLARYYAYEMACHRDILRYKNGAPCPEHYLRDPEVCRPCAAAHLAPAMRAGTGGAWLQEYLVAEAFRPEYWAVAQDALTQLSAAIVYNEVMAACLAPWVKACAIVPGGVDCERFAFVAAPADSRREKVILMSGRGEDPAKGLAVLLEAGGMLRAARSDFVVQATVPEDTPGPPWFQPLGWCDQETLCQRYANADICVLPSIWEEPFGIVAVEAMASGRPVCASRMGGLQHIVQHTETGFLFPAGDATELAKQLSLLLDNAELRQRMGAAGRRRVEAEYSWPEVVRRHYPPLFERCIAALAER